MEQNKRIENGINRPIASLDLNVKNDLRNSHFIVGNFEPSYNTVFRSEFYNKSNIKDNSVINLKTIEKQRRGHNYILGSDKPNYKSETQDNFTAPTPKGFQTQDEHKISTHELQKSHYMFGNSNDCWSTTAQSSYYPKEIRSKKITNDTTRTNFILGQDKPGFKSVSQEIFVPHQAVTRNDIKEAASNLRSN